MSRTSAIVFCLIFCSFRTASSETCTTLPSGDSGECVNLYKCPVLMESFKKDRNNAPTICNRESRKICCPLKNLAQRENDHLASRGSASEKESTDSQVFTNEADKQCFEFRSLLFNNETVGSFIFGEQPKVHAVPFCHQNKANIGVAHEKEFSHIAVIKVENLLFPVNDFFSRLCAGSVISNRHVLTSFHCVYSIVNLKISIYLGVFNLNSIEDGQMYDIDNVNANYGISILTLNKKIKFSENVLPICFHSGKDLSPPIVLAGWTGDWRECDPKLKKWHIEHINDTIWNYKVPESAIIKALMIGSPLQIYRSEGNCQYSLIGFYEHLAMGHYNFNNLNQKWIENIVWPKKLTHMSTQTFNIMQKAWRPASN